MREIMSFIKSKRWFLVTISLSILLGMSLIGCNTHETICIDDHDGEDCPISEKMTEELVDAIDGIGDIGEAMKDKVLSDFFGEEGLEEENELE